MRGLLLVTLASCSEPEPAFDTATLATLEYRIPEGWQARDRSTLQRATVEWTPKVDNDRKESLVISRVDSPALAAAKSRPHLKRTLVDANAHLPGALFGAPRAFITRAGLFGLRVDGTFTPPDLRRDQAASYHRTHAVLALGESLVHVLYTARDPDREHIEVVLDGFKPGA